MELRSAQLIRDEQKAMGRARVASTGEGKIGHLPTPPKEIRRAPGGVIPPLIGKPLCTWGVRPPPKENRRACLPHVIIIMINVKKSFSGEFLSPGAIAAAVKHRQLCLSRLKRLWWREVASRGEEKSSSHHEFSRFRGINCSLRTCEVKTTF